MPAVAVRLEDVHDHRERRAIAELVRHDLEGHRDAAGKQGCPVLAVDPLAHADQGREHA
jgi:hypothetical protein